MCVITMPKYDTYRVILLKLNGILCEKFCLKTEKCLRRVVGCISTDQILHIYPAYLLYVVYCIYILVPLLG